MSFLLFEAAVKTFPPGKPGTRALDGVSFSAAKGEIIAVRGPNASGKTTLLKLAAAYLLPDAGRVCVGGLETAGRAAGALCGYSSGEARSFYWRLTGRQNLDFFSALRGAAPKPADGGAGLFKALGLTPELLDKRFDTYSSGTAQKLSLARALLAAPALAALDEPFNGLDEAASAGLKDFLRGAAAGGALVLFSSHDRADTEGFATRELRLEAGRLA